jgi:hypothetical protein
MCWAVGLPVVQTQTAAMIELETSRPGSRPTSLDYINTELVHTDFGWYADYGVSLLTRVLQLANELRVPKQVNPVLIKSASVQGGCSMYWLAT